jgi:hypothetical protein
MELVAGTGRRPLQIKSLAQPGQGAFSGTRISLALAHNLFEASGQQALIDVPSSAAITRISRSWTWKQLALTLRESFRQRQRRNVA